jgi:alpha-tubulin suppressor-like RCC1 family protein
MSVVSKRVALCVALLVCLAAAQPCLAAISAGDGHTLIVKPDGTVWAWGQNYAGQLGDGSTTQRTIPTQVSGLTSITAVAAGASHSLALKSDGSVWAWGANDSGQLGIGLTSNVNAPVQISGISNVVAITAGATFSLAVRSDGTVWAWGANDRGQLGNSTGASSGTPIQISGLTNVTAIAAGYAHGLARAIDGAVYAWGNNSSGQLGDGSYQPRTTPVAVASVTDIVAISAGQAFSLALGADGTVWSWGDNGFGQLGGGTGYTRPTPSVIAGLANVASIQAAAYSAYAITNDGTLLDWGVNWNGQLGDGTTNSYTTPTTITTLSSLRELAAGSGFVVAVTTTNQVWSWGANYYGQLGDGTTRQRYLPVAISDAGMVWKVATPTFSPDGGTYEPDLLVFITSATTTATVHYTTDGSEPTESSPVLSPNNGLPLPVSLTIRARAFTNGMPASNEASAIYTLQVARPTATLSGGTYNTPQTLVLQTRTANATIHYTIDGSDPTESSPTYSEPIPVNQSTTVRARAFRNGSDPSDLLFTDIQLQVKPPVPSPQPGTYASAQVVTLTAEADAVIHYTLDFSEPNETSPIYSAPIATSSGPTTIYAKAFRTGWTPSSTMRASYNTGVDTTAPTIVARVRPDPNSAGWNHTPVTVSFDCQDDFADPLQCSPPVSLSTEGAGQVVSGTAQDAAGHTTGTTVTVNIDLTPPTLTLSDPMEGTTTSAASITIHALVADALSGLATPRCNGVPATVDSSGNLTCDVALGKGVNTIVLQTLDVAGNNTSTSLHVTRTGSPTTLTIVPSTVTLRVGQQQRLLARTEFGATPDGLTWSTSDASVVNLVADQPGKIQAVAAGTATITASDGTLSAQAHVTVSADLTLQVGTVLWALQPTVLGRAAWSVHANKIDPDGPDLYMVDQTDDGWFLKGVRSDGVELTREVLPMSPSDSLAQLAGDAFGGVLIRVNHECSPPYEQCVSIIRAGAGDVGAWQYRPASGLSNRFVQNNAGDLFLLEYRLDGAATYFGIPYA